MTDLVKGYNERIFESIKQMDENGEEFWYARDLQKALEYGKWENFNLVVEKAKKSCISAGNSDVEHVADVRKMFKAGNGAENELLDYKLSRYFCYLIVQNADPRKQVVALGQAYFAVKTRERELEQNLELDSEDIKRIERREEITEKNKKLAIAAKYSGVETPKDYGVFQNYGYRGLYGGLDMQDIHKKKNLKKSQSILDHMSSLELASNIFRAAQTEDKLRREQVSDKQKANIIHTDVGIEVREAIKRIGGTMPENLPVPKESVKKLKTKNINKLLK